MPTLHWSDHLFVIVKDVSSSNILLQKRNTFDFTRKHSNSSQTAEIEVDVNQVISFLLLSRALLLSLSFSHSSLHPSSPPAPLAPPHTHTHTGTHTCTCTIHMQTRYSQGYEFKFLKNTQIFRSCKKTYWNTSTQTHTNTHTNRVMEDD